MPDDKHDAEPKQKTKPKKGKPIEIPIPKRDALLRDLAKITKPQKGSTTKRQTPSDER